MKKTEKRAVDDFMDFLKHRLAPGTCGLMMSMDEMGWAYGRTQSRIGQIIKQCIAEKLLYRVGYKTYIIASELKKLTLDFEKVPSCVDAPVSITIGKKQYAEIKGIPYEEFQDYRFDEKGMQISKKVNGKWYEHSEGYLLDSDWELYKSQFGEKHDQ